MAAAETSGSAAPQPAAMPGAAPAAAGAPTRIPWLGIVAVLLGTFISTLNTRLTSFGLADIRGAVHAGFDEGAWITTAQTVAQMLIAPAAVWLGYVYGSRRILMEAALGFALVSAIEPFATNLPMLLALQFVGGLCSGCFVPLTLSFILRNVPPAAWAYGVAVYALNLEVSLNISASIEGWYVEHLSWRWIFWQNVPLALGMAACLGFGVKALPPVDPQRRPDWFGIFTGGAGLALIYAGLDQGNRLDWTSSGVVWGTVLAGSVLIIGFLIAESRARYPAVDLKVAFTAPMPRLLLLFVFLRLTILSTAIIIPQFLQTVRGYHALEVGHTMVWIAAPQLAVCVAAGFVLRRFDSRLVASVGFICVCIACWLVADGLTPLWGSREFLPSSLLQSMGQSFALSGTVFFAVLHLKPEDSLTFGACLQTARLMGGELGTAFVTTFVRVRGQIASNLLGQHVQIGDPQVLARIAAYGAATARGDPALATARGTAVLGNAVHAASVTQGIIDAFVVLAVATAVTVMLVVTRRAAPADHPAAPRPIFRRRAGRPA